MSDIFDIYLLEAVLNGLLLGGLFALLSLGLNLVFGVIDVVWICYAELIMCGMYGVYYLHVQYHWPLLLAMAASVGIVAFLGWLLHQFVIRPVLNAEPINQLLVTGGVLFFLQAAATLVFGIEFRNLGVTLPSVRLGEMSFSAARLVAFGAALGGVIALYLFLTRTYLGTAIRAISQDRAIMPLMGVSPARIFTITSALGGALAGLAITTKTELLLLLLGGLFVIITLSVVIQVGSFKLTGKRVFRMAPLQHHFELAGWAETTIVVRFWIIAGICVALGLGIFYVG